MSSAPKTAVANGRRPMPAKRRLKAVTRKLRELGSIGSAVMSTGHPYMAHIVPMRRCNLACTYCNEYDDFSDPVPLAAIAGDVAACRYKAKPARVFRFEDVSEAHRVMESNQANGKLVVIL